MVVDVVLLPTATRAALLGLQDKVTLAGSGKAALSMLMFSAEAAVVALAQEALAALVLARPEETVLPHQSQVHQSHVLAAVGVVSGLLVPLRVQVAQEAAVTAAQMLMALRVRLIQAAAEVAAAQGATHFASAALAVLVW